MRACFCKYICVCLCVFWNSCGPIFVSIQPSDLAHFGMHYDELSKKLSRREKIISVLL